MAAGERVVVGPGQDVVVGAAQEERRVVDRGVQGQHRPGRVDRRVGDRHAAATPVPRRVSLRGGGRVVVGGDVVRGGVLDAAGDDCDVILTEHHRVRRAVRYFVERPATVDAQDAVVVQKAAGDEVA